MSGGQGELSTDSERLSPESVYLAQRRATIRKYDDIPCVAANLATWSKIDFRLVQDWAEKKEGMESVKKVKPIHAESLVAASSRLEILRHGLDDDLVMLRKLSQRANSAGVK